MVNDLAAFSSKSLMKFEVNPGRGVASPLISEFQVKLQNAGVNGGKDLVNVPRLHETLQDQHCRHAVHSLSALFGA